MTQIRPRDPPSDTSPSSSGHSSNYKAAIISVSVLAVVCGVAALVLLFLRWRRSRAIRYSLSGRDDNEHHRDVETAAATSAPATAQTAPGDVNRTTSIRSVMTLPPYRPKPAENEHVLGREGERGGIDVVIELPTAETEEAMRDEEMEALFQIRQARRRQMAEREARRQARRDAQARNDRAALHAIRQQTHQANATNAGEIENLRGELVRARETRQRTVSSVSYADVGVARHDGTRIRANSNESERMGLLSDAASISASNRSPASLTLAQTHSRAHSASSLLSIDTLHSDAQPTRPGSSPDMVDAVSADLGGVYMPPISPPGYDEVSLDGDSPAHSRSVSPYPEPPPEYTSSTEGAEGQRQAQAQAQSQSPGQSPGQTPSPAEERNRRLSAHVASLAAEATQEASSDEEQASRRNSAIPRLPSLRLTTLPQIVIEPSSAVPRDNER